MAIHGPSTLRVECDVCGAEIDVDVTEYGGDPPSWGVDTAEIEAKGWIVDDDGDHLCPDCQDSGTDEGGE